MKTERNRITGILQWGLLALGAVAPWLGIGSYWTRVFIIGFYYVLLVGSWNLLSGYTGQFSFAHMAFASLGAYVSALTSIRLGISPWLGLALAMVGGTVVGVVLGLLCLRMRSLYLALTTIAFAEVYRIVVTQAVDLTRGPLGLFAPPLFQGRSQLPYYYTALGLAVGVTLLLSTLVRSPLGRVLDAIRQDELATRSVGVNIVAYKLFIFALSAAIAALGGAFMGHYTGLVSPDSATLTQMGLVIAMGVIGGIGTLAGPVIGGFGITVLSELIRTVGDYDSLVFAVILVVVLRFVPSGVASFLHRPEQASQG